MLTSPTVHRRRPRRCPTGATARCGCRTPAGDGPAPVRHHRPAVGVRPDHRRRAVQGPGAQPAGGMVVRAHRRRRRQPRRRRARPQRARRPRRRSRCRSRSIVRGYITGVTVTSLWRQYADGARTIYGYRFPDGLHEEHRAAGSRSSRRPPRPSTGGHDEPLTCAEVVERGLVDAGPVGAGDGRGARRCSPAASEVAAGAGLILADTKYEFGLDRRRRAAADRRGAHARLVAVLGGRHATRSDWPPARSRRASTRRSCGGRSPTPATAATATPPELPTDVWAATSARYIDAYERLTGTPFRARQLPGRRPDRRRHSGMLTAISAPP